MIMKITISGKLLDKYKNQHEVIKEITDMFVHILNFEAKELLEINK